MSNQDDYWKTLVQNVPPPPEAQPHELQSGEQAAKEYDGLWRAIHVAIAIDRVRELLKTLPLDYRLDVFRRIQEGYCPHCGFEDPKGTCQCSNEE